MKDILLMHVLANNNNNNMSESGNPHFHVPLSYNIRNLVFLAKLVVSFTGTYNDEVEVYAIQRIHLVK